MTIEEKLELLSNSMTRSKRDDDTEYYHFTDNAPEELKDLYLENYEVRDIDYQIFSTAIDHIIETNNYLDASGDKFDRLAALSNEIDEGSSEFASVYTSDRLAYLNIWNQDEVTEMLKNYGLDDIATACAVWYDEQVLHAARLIVQEYIAK